MFLFRFSRLRARRRFFPVDPRSSEVIRDLAIAGNQPNMLRYAVDIPLESLEIDLTENRSPDTQQEYPDGKLSTVGACGSWRTQSRRLDTIAPPPVRRHRSVSRETFNTSSKVRRSKSRLIRTDLAVRAASAHIARPTPKLPQLFHVKRDPGTSEISDAHRYGSRDWGWH